MKKKLVPAIFLDRDGTINSDNGYIDTINKFKFIEGVIDAMYTLKQMGYALVIVTNQSGIARGKFTEVQLKTINKWVTWFLANKNINLDSIYYCPHHPNGKIEKYRQICNCRKPHAGMLKLAQKHLHIDMSISFMVGDKLADMQAAKNAGVKTKVLIHSGKTIITKKIQKSADWIISSLKILPKQIKDSRKIT